MADSSRPGHVLEAMHHCGIVIYTVLDGGVEQGVQMVERDLAPNGWTGRFLPVMEPEKAMTIFRAGRHAELVEEADLFVHLRRAIVTDPRNSVTDGIPERADALIAHLQPHRPMAMFAGPEDCLLGDCDHDVIDGNCPDVTVAARICRACSAWYDPGGEYGLDWIEAGRVSWPCPPVRNVAAYYKIQSELQSLDLHTGKEPR